MDKTRRERGGNTVIALFVATVVLLFLGAVLFYRQMQQDKRIELLEFRLSKQFDAEAKTLAAMGEANELNGRVEALEKIVSTANREVTMLVSKQHEIDAETETRQKREKKARVVRVPMARGW